MIEPINEINCVELLDANDSHSNKNLFYKIEDQSFTIPIIGNSFEEVQKCKERIQFSKSNFSFSNDEPILKIAFLDSGIFTNHPIFKPYIKECIDFTGEGVDDYNGHGSLCTWIFLCDLDLKVSVELYIAKILKNDGTGTPTQMIQGLQWAAEKKVRLINMSAGIDNTKFFGLWECNGDCKVCNAAYELKDKNILLIAAAGNNKNTVCPAKLGLLKSDAPVISVGAKKEMSNEAENWSGKGNIYKSGLVTIQEIECI